MEKPPPVRGVPWGRETNLPKRLRPRPLGRQSSFPQFASRPQRGARAAARPPSWPGSCPKTAFLCKAPPGGERPWREGGGRHLAAGQSAERPARWPQARVRGCRRLRRTKGGIRRLTPEAAMIRVHLGAPSDESNEYAPSVQ